jgi:hypothetical protein
MYEYLVNAVIFKKIKSFRVKLLLVIYPTEYKLHVIQM